MQNPSVRFLAIVSPTRSGFSASIPDVPGCVAAGKTHELAVTAIEEALALHLQALEPGESAPQAHTTQVDDLETDEQIVWVSPAQVNPVSLTVAEAIRETGKSLRALADEIGVNYSALSRMQDPFYWGHSLSSLRRLAQALGQEVKVDFVRAA